MGTVLYQSINETKKIDMDIFLSSYSKNYKLESYLRDDIFKTLLVTSKEDSNSNLESGIPFVIKLFPIENDNYLLYSQKFDEIKQLFSNLESNPNVVPIIKRTELEGANAGIIIRQYIQYNLKQALYYLTCYSEIEKKWICFQLLHGLQQIHSKMKCHGDIKPENILVSSKLSVFFSDISVYKPVYLEIENLQYYNNFFCSNSDDRACYIAPERFVHNLEEVRKNNLDQLTTEMDIFSLGVVFAEIFSDRQNIFTQNDLVNYKNEKININEKLKGIRDINVRKIIKEMINLDPKKRIKLENLIRIFGNSLCPAPITKFIFHLNKMIIVYDYYKNDLFAALLHKHFIQIWKSLCINNNILEKMQIPKLKKKLNKYLILQLINYKYNIYKINIYKEFPLAFIPNSNKDNNNEIFIETEINKKYFNKDNNSLININCNDNINNENDCTILIIKYLLSCLENLKYISTYLSIFEMIYNLSKILISNKNPNVIIDLVIPNYINLFNFNDAKLSIETYNSIIDILNLINYDELILNKIDYNYFNYYVFENIYGAFLKSDKLEFKCAIISRLDEIIELENNFLLSFLNTINNNISIKEKNKEMKNELFKAILYKSYISPKMANENDEEKNDEKNKAENIDFNYVYKNYINDCNSFKKKLKDLVKKIMEEDNKNDCLKLLIIQKYRDICLFCGNYEENKQLLNHLYILFNRNNFYLQKEIIKIFPSLILLLGNKLFYDYFLIFVESTCLKKNSELIIMEIIDALIILLKMNLIHHKGDYYSKNYKILMCYKLLLPYIVHPNYLLREKLNYLFNQVIPKEQIFSELYISFYKNLKSILSENNKPITVISLVNQHLINEINKYYSLPREIFLIYKYNIECSYFKTNYINKKDLLSKITKIKSDHFINIIKNDKNMRNNLGLLEKSDILKIKEKSLFKRFKQDYSQMIKSKGLDDEKNSIMMHHFKNRITILLNEINDKKAKNNFFNKWFQILSKDNVIYCKIIFLLKVLNYQLDINDVITNNLYSDDKINEEGEYKDWNVMDGSILKSVNPWSYITKEHSNNRFCYELSLNQCETIIKLIPVNCNNTKCYQNYFVSISDEGIIRLHQIYKETKFENIYTIKNRIQYKKDLENFILKKNHISYVEKLNKIMVFIVIHKQIEIFTFKLNNENWNENKDNSKDSNVFDRKKFTSEKEIVCIENMAKTDNNYVVLGNNDNSISFYNYINNNFDYINNCSYFFAWYGNIELIISLISSNDILISTSNGFVIFYDFNLRSFTHAYSFSKAKRIKQMIEYIPNKYTETIIFKNLDKNSKSIFLFILTNDDQITLWNLSSSNPIIIYELKINQLDDYNKNKKTSNIPQLEKISLEKDNTHYSISSKCDNNPESQFIKININYISDMKTSSFEIITGEKQGICRALNFSNENLKNIKDKQTDKFNQIIFYDNKYKKIEAINKSKYSKENKMFIIKLLYTISDKKQNEITKNIYDEKKEMTDLIVLRNGSFYSNDEFVICGYSNGAIKLWMI